MIASSPCETAGMYTPAIYQIRVGGTLDEEWSDRIAGMNITKVSGSGVLNTLYELHLPVLSVDCLENG